ncbi:MAG TPA: hypothetical protein VG013_34815 [Gemmataceae bacterium]|nr:hypothetical protein [Gemmataceae bacterium]
MAVLNKIVHAGVTNPSFAQASRDLAVLAEIEVPVKQVERVSKRIGQERVAERDAAVTAYQKLPLVERKGVPAGVTAPDVAVVGCDGGRLQILQRSGAKVEAEQAADAEDGRAGKHWREDKIGLLMTMASQESARDPCPEIPEQFVDPTRILKLARELKKQALPSDEAVQETAEPEVGVETLAANGHVWEPPEVKEKRLLGSRVRWPDFGPMLALAAWTWGFFGARQRAFIGDGSANNWTIWRQYFSSFVPILDFIHALSYVFAAALAGRAFAVGWPIYQEWIGWLWSGAVAQVIAALAQRQLELGAPTEQDGETSPRQVVARTLAYLQNHQEQMRYAEYRRLGLPITSSYVESAVKQFNQRVKGTEKFWSEEGAEALLQLRADHLSDHEPLRAFWQSRQAGQTGQRPYSKAA